MQFCISPPKTDIENNVIVSDYAQMDRILKEERNYILQMVKKVRYSRYRWYRRGGGRGGAVGAQCSRWAGGARVAGASARPSHDRRAL